MQAESGAWGAKEPQILAEEADFLILNKPSGLSVHPDGRSSAPTLADWISQSRPELRGVGEPMRLQNGTVIDRPGIVHRLDRETSGIILVAKNQPAFEFFKKAFQERLVEKKYVAFVHGVIARDEGVIDRPIGTSRKDFRLRSAQRGAKGVLREAVTEYFVDKRGADVTFVEVYPKTGRTHQIRVHFKAINHPVVCDSQYAPNHPKLLGFERLALHASSLTFQKPSGERVTFEAPLPADFVSALAQMGV